nr:hypothetical protein CFP56_09911 [Quercus suber]
MPATPRDCAAHAPIIRPSAAMRTCELRRPHDSDEHHRSAMAPCLHESMNVTGHRPDDHPESSLQVEA